MALNHSREPETNFPTGIGKPAQRALVGAGYTRLEELTSVTEVELLKLHGIGPKAHGILRSALEARSLSFAAVEGESA